MRVMATLDKNTQRSAKILNEPSIKLFSDIIDDTSKPTYINSLFDSN